MGEKVKVKVPRATPTMAPHRAAIVSRLFLMNLIMKRK